MGEQVRLILLDSGSEGLPVLHIFIPDRFHNGMEIISDWLSVYNRTYILVLAIIRERSQRSYVMCCIGFLYDILLVWPLNRHVKIKQP